jgi:hypothetical protein
MLKSFKFQVSSFKLILFCSLFTIHCSYSQGLRKVENKIFRKGETLKYEAYYHSFITGRVTAGIVTLNIADETTPFYNRDTYHVIGTGKTKGLFNLFYKVIDRYDTYIDTEALAPWKFVRRVNEGDYIIDQDIFFNQFDNTAKIYHYKNKRAESYTKDLSMPAYTQDIISAFYYARTFDVTDIKMDQEFKITFILDDSLFTTKIIYKGRENITTRLGEFRCMKFKPMLLKGAVFSEPYPMAMYISDDEDRIPIMAESEVLVGTVRLELIKYSDLANPLTSKIK